MKNLWFNSKKAKEEADEKERVKVADREEKNYLAILRGDKLFQKYIIEKRLKANITSLSDITNIPNMTAELLEREVMARNSTVRVLKDIVNSIKQ